MNFEEELERYKEAVDTDIKQIELVISWLEQFRANFEDNTIDIVISFFKGYKSRARLEESKTIELSWHIEDKE